MLCQLAWGARSLLKREYVFALRVYESLCNLRASFVESLRLLLFHHGNFRWVEGGVE